jgi:Serine-pyruvate aminotransferase/archaeal aspartate aminotransferase
VIGLSVSVPIFPPPGFGGPFLFSPGPLSPAFLVYVALFFVWGCWVRVFRVLSFEFRRSLLSLLGPWAYLYDCVPIPGSGTFAVVSMLGTFIPFAGMLLVLAHGAYGLRAALTMDCFYRDFLLLDMGVYFPP